MRIEGPGFKPTELMEKAQKLTEQLPGQVKEFEQVLESLKQQGQQPEKIIQNSMPETTKSETVQGADKLLQEKIEDARKPGGVEKLLSEIEHGQGRLNELIQQVRSGKTFSPQELIGIQAEMHQITVQLETATKVVSQVVQGVKQLLQQQV